MFYFFNSPFSPRKLKKKEAPKPVYKKHVQCTLCGKVYPVKQEWKVAEREFLTCCGHVIYLLDKDDGTEEWEIVKGQWKRTK